jgi:queuine/archaeosine tRNA-ribosyltransferase
MDDRKLIVIPAVPSSGTSALAGVLHHLGVDMGAYSLEDSMSKRGYEMFEDGDINLFCSRIESDKIPLGPKLLTTRCRWRHYVNHRLITSEKDNLIGCKLPTSCANVAG